MKKRPVVISGKKTDFIRRARFTLALPFAAFDEQREIFRVS